MAVKKKLIEMDAKHQEWLKKSARDLGKYEKDILYHIFENAIKTNVLDSFKQQAVTSELQRTLDKLSKGAQEIAQLQERSKELLEKMENGDGGKG